jgi:Fe-S oxidoreductase
MNTTEATRQIYWNISHVWVMYVLLLPALVVSGYGIYRHVACWRRGRPLARFDHPGERIRLLLKHALAQNRTARDRYAGLFHRFIFYGFIILLVATTVVAIDADLGIHIMRGSFYLYFQSFTVDVFGALVLLGIVMAAVRRLLARPKKLVYTDEAVWILAVIFVIVATGFLLEAWRIVAAHDPWRAWSPFGDLVARAMQPVMSLESMRAAHRFTWWFHLILSFGFLAWIPYTKMMHVITGPLNIYTANLGPIGGALKAINFEQTTTFGVNSLNGFTWKDLLDLDACTECGRCTSVCPANTVGKRLSPRDIIIQLRNLMHQRPREVFGLAALNEMEATASGVAASATAEGNGETPAALPIIGAVEATSADRLWECTTCAACVEACPIFIEQMPKIVDMRRHLVMEQAEFPDSMQEAVTSLERRGHPFRGTQATRLDWAEGLPIPQIGDAAEAEILLWVGCAGALVERNQKITRVVAQLLAQAGVKFGILGREEKCCGDPARRIGNEFLFETLAKENIAVLNKHAVRKIITACPHCFNTLKNEYPQHGGNFDVQHHSEFLAHLVSEGKLKVLTPSAAKITFHDPCYLGRQNGIYQQPRELVQISSMQDSLEMQRNRSGSFCCGGGGGMSFVEEPPNRRVNQERAREALDTGANVVAVACPFCMTMMEDGVNARKGDSEASVRDVAELLLEAVRPHSQDPND